MTSTRAVMILVFLTTLGLWTGCRVPAPEAAMPTPPGSSTVLLSVTSDATEAPQSVDMALKLAGFSVQEGRKVVMFFNVRGVTVPLSDFPEDFAFQDEEPIRGQLSGLIEKGVEVHVCPICMKALGVQESDLLVGARVTNRADLFSHIGPDTAVFTY